MPLVTGVVCSSSAGSPSCLHDDLFIKLKPTIVNSLFGAVLLGGLAFGRPLLPVCSTPCCSSTRRVAEADLPLGPVLFRARGDQRGRLAHADDGFLGELQGVRHHAVTIAFALAQTPLILRHEPTKPEEPAYPGKWWDASAPAAAALQVPRRTGRQGLRRRGGRHTCGRSCHPVRPRTFRARRRRPSRWPRVPLASTPTAAKDFPSVPRKLRAFSGWSL